MSDSDSFISEVSEEVRREKLYGYLRRYGWVAVAAVLLLVGGAAWNEYRNAQQRSLAQATGDAMLTALEETEAGARAAAMSGIEAEGSTVAVTLLMQAAMQEEAGEIAAASDTLGHLSIDQDVPEMYRELAAIKAAMLPSDNAADRLITLEALAKPGKPFRLLAMEQIAYMTLSAGDKDGAIAVMRQIEEDAAVSRGLRDRVQTLMVALGEPLPDAVTQ